MLLVVLFVTGCGAGPRSGSANSYFYTIQYGSSFTPPGGGSTSGFEICRAMTTDSNGTAFCAGETSSNWGEEAGGDDDVLILQFTSTGGVNWARQLGDVTKAVGGDNSGTDRCNAIAAGPSGAIYCAGQTNGSMGETNGGGNDAFILKLSVSGELQWVRQLGSVTTVPGGDTSGDDACNAIAIDDDENIYCAGTTASSLGEANGGGTDAFYMKVSSDGALLDVVQAGGTTVVSGGDSSGDETGVGIGFDKDDNIYLGGSTSGDFIAASSGDADMFVLKFDSTGALTSGKQVGGSDRETLNAMAVDSSGGVFFCGLTASDFAETSGGGQDILILRINPGFADFTWKKQFGSVTKAISTGKSDLDDRCLAMQLKEGYLYLGGATASAFMETNGGGDDAWGMKLRASDGKSLWSRHYGAVTAARLGGSAAGTDRVLGVAGDEDGRAYLTGSTTAGLFTSFGGNTDIFLAKIRFNGRE